MNKWESLAGSCDSPIEVALAVGLSRSWDESQYPISIRMPQSVCRISSRFADDLVLIPQASVVADGNRYRLDFLFVCGSRPGARRFLCVECDGHDWHEKTKEQAARDKRRDRDLLAARVPTVRFSGSEIHYDALGCADYVEGLATSLYADYLQAEAGAGK